MFTLKELTANPHRRLNPLTGEWVLVSPHRTQRPWQGQLEKLPAESLPSYDPECYLCPGNSRAGGKRNPDYTGIFVFDNDFPALLAGTPAASASNSGLLVSEAEQGVCRVICYSPHHDLTMSRMETPAIRQVIDNWAEQFMELGNLEFVNYVQIFENRGAMMGCSNPHPHCQIWANSSLPNEVFKESASQTDYATAKGSSLLGDYLAVELKEKERIIIENDHFVVMAPFWAFWPFETMILGKRHVGGIDELNSEERNSLASILKKITTIYDNLFEISFPYSMGFHQRPADRKSHPEWRLHAHFYPPLLRSATVRKFMVGYELLASPQRDITPEAAAARLREVSEQHYLG